LSESIPYEGEDGAKALDPQQIPGEALLQPRDGDHVQAAGKSLVWKEHRAGHPYIDFFALHGRQSIFCLTYAVCYLHSDTDHTDLALLVGSAEHAKLYLNGQEVYRQFRRRLLVLDEDEVKPITLHKGINVLVFKVIYHDDTWAGSIHVVTKDGRPAKGVRFGIEP
jgi:hypothetical protein